MILVMNETNHRYAHYREYRRLRALALRRRPIPGPRPKLSEAQRAELADLLDRGAEAAGFVGEFWTTKRIAALIRRRFGVRYHPAHVSRLVRWLGFSVQK